MRCSRCQAEISPGTAGDKEVARDKGTSRRAATGLNIAQGSLSLARRMLRAPPARPRRVLSPGGRQQPRPCRGKPGSGWRGAAIRPLRCPGRGESDGSTEIREDEEIAARQEGFAMAGVWLRGTGSAGGAAGKELGSTAGKGVTIAGQFAMGMLSPGNA